MEYVAAMSALLLGAMKVLAYLAGIWVFFAGPTLFKRQREILRRLEAIDRRLAERDAR